ncbi:FtsK/SpoIIIE domain-containing protein, partial [Streptomyces lycii]
LLIEGGPGTGKTELLRALAASLAAADRPDRLALLLVDGGGVRSSLPEPRGDLDTSDGGLRACTDLPHVSTYLPGVDPVRMRAFAQALSSELKRRAQLFGELDFTAWHDRRARAGSAPPGPGRGGAGRPAGDGGGDLEPEPSGTLRLRARRAAEDTEAAAASRAAEETGPDPVPRLVVLVDDFDALLAPALGSTGRPAAGSVVRALESVARHGARLGVHLVASSGRPERTSETAAAEAAGLRVALEVLPARTDGPERAEAAPGRGRLTRRDGTVTPFQAGRVTGRIPRTATQRPTVVPLEWDRMGDPPARRPVRELGNGPTDLALLASALQRAARSAEVHAAPPLI